MGHEKGANYITAKFYLYCVLLCLQQVEDKTLLDKDVAQMIIQRLEKSSVSVPFAEISRFAKEVGRKELATRVRAIHMRTYIMILCACTLQ